MQKIVEYRERLDRTLASDDLRNKEYIRNLVRDQLIRSSPPDTHGFVDEFLENRTTEVSEFLDTLRSASKSGKEVSDIDETSQRDWKLKQDNEDFRVMYREGAEGTPFHTLLVEGYVDAPLDVCLVISWEAALFRKWWPQYHVPPFKITSSECLQAVRLGEQVIRMRVKVAWPLSARETVLHYFELEYLKDDLIIVLLKSISDTGDINRSTHGYTKDGIPDAKDFIRIDCVGGFVLQKVAPSISYFRTIATMDVKLDFVPPSLINFLSRQLIGNGFKFYKKTVASIAKGGDEDFGKALKGPLYSRVREGLLPENKTKKASEALESAQVPFSDSQVHTSSQVGIPTYKSEIEEVDVEQETERKSHDKIESEVDRVVSPSSANPTTNKYYQEKTFISPEVEHALRVLDNAIAMVQKGLPIRNWAGFGSNSQELQRLGSVGTEVGSNDGGSMKVPNVDNMESLEEDESSSGFFDIRHDKQDSPLRETNDNHTSSISPILLETSNSSYTNHNNVMLKELDTMSKEIDMVSIKVNGIHEGSENGGEVNQKKQRRCCLYFFPVNK
ncbi:hypothetical protein ACHQM5_019747 [Ranunculus cassubicifolius]